MTAPSDAGALLPAETKGPPFTIASRSESFSSLAEAIAAANDGEVIAIHGHGSFETTPLSWQGKALTLRAASGTRPRLTMKSVGDPWQALLQTDRSLTLEGLDLMVAADSAMPLIRCLQAPLYLTSCRLIGGEDSTAIIARHPREVMVRRCQIDAGAVGLSIEVGRTPCRVHLSDCRLQMRQESAAALSLWAAEQGPTNPVELELQGNTIQAGRTIALRSLSASPTITARDNQLTYHTALLSYSGFAERDAWRGTVWQGGGNSYNGPATWLWVEGGPVTATEKAALR